MYHSLRGQSIWRGCCYCYCCQCLSASVHQVGLKWWRAVRSGLIGALNNGLVHYSYYKWIDRRFPYHMFSEKRWGPPDGAKSRLAIGLTKWAIEWPTIGLYKVSFDETRPTCFHVYTYEDGKSNQS